MGYRFNKRRYFKIEEMVDKINQLFVGEEQITVITYDELTAELAVKYSAAYLLRGLRNTTDFEYENSIAQVNKTLNSDLETVFLITSPEFASISSSVIREVHRYGGDVSAFLPYAI